MGVDILDIQHWVEDQMIRGRYMFTKQDVLDLGLPIKDVSVKRSLQRLEAKGTIMSPWQNFYVAVATEYKLKGVVPPSFYIDKLMAFLGRDYYVSHLTAAALNGASHQMAMVFQTMVSGGPIRSGVKNGTKLEFTLRQKLPLEFTHKVKTQSGYMTVADAELTALDVVAEIPPVQQIRLKVEINCFEHFNVLGLQEVPFRVENSWFVGEAKLTTYHLEELVGTKVRALYQRKKGRDLFDLYMALTAHELDGEMVLECYRNYIEFVADKAPSYKEFVQNMEQKMQDEEFLEDVVPLLRPEILFDPQKAYSLVYEQLIDKMPGRRD